MNTKLTRNQTYYERRLKCIESINLDMVGPFYVMQSDLAEDEEEGEDEDEALES